MNDQEKIENINSIVTEFKKRLSVLRSHQFQVMERLVDKTDARRIAKLKEELNKDA